MRGWKFIGLTATIILYVLGVLVLSIVNLNPTQKRARVNSRFATDTDFHHHHHNPEVGLLRKTPIQLQWCTELKFRGQTSSPFKLKTAKPLQTFRGHFINTRNNFILDTDSISNQVLKNTKPAAEEAAAEVDTKKVDNLGVESSTKSQKSDITEFNVDVKTTTTDKSASIVALASFPGSGNTWLRYLLQQSTGIFTGSVYKDYGLLKSGFPAESISNSSVLTVKTHEWGESIFPKFHKAVLLVRDPAKAIIAEFNRQSGGHIGFASPERYRRTKGRYWSKFVSTKLHAWEQTNLSWGQNYTKPLLIVFYESLVDDVERTIREILRFIEHPINEELLRCALLRKEGIYRRKKRLLAFDPFTPKMKQMIEEKRIQVYAELRRIKRA